MSWFQEAPKSLRDFTERAHPWGHSRDPEAIGPGLSMSLTGKAPRCCGNLWEDLLENLPQAT